MWGRSLLGCVLAAALALGGCGGAMRADELGRSVETLASTAAEGALLADDAAKERTKATFTRVRARELGETVEHEAEKLADAGAEGAVATRKARALALADAIDAALGQLQTSPTDAAEARTAADDLDALAARATRLAEAP